jgi:hypothetical protein
VKHTIANDVVVKLNIDFPVKDLIEFTEYLKNSALVIIGVSTFAYIIKYRFTLHLYKNER